MFPARRSWPRPTKAERNRAIDAGNDPYQAVLTSYLLRGLYLPASSAPAWSLRLRHFISDVQKRIAKGNISISPYRLFAEDKKKEVPPGIRVFRALSKFDFETKIVASLVSTYARREFDEVFSGSSYAFRTGRPDRAPPTHHDAARAIADFRSRAGNRKVWVAEVDLMGFFDLVPHKTVLHEYDRLADLVRLRNGSPDPALRKAIALYTKGYSFVAAKQELDTRLCQKHQGTAQRHEIGPTRIELDALGLDPDARDFGLPQGGSLSCFLANVVLDSADKAIEAILEKQPSSLSLYLRYCDDIIILSTNRELVRRALRGYLNETRRLGHHSHAPDGTNEYSKDFWSKKSKNPYLWAESGWRGHGFSPWCSFVGYQFARATKPGLVRIRPSSEKKEIERIQEMASETCNRFWSSKISAGAVRHRLRQRIRFHITGTGKWIRKGSRPQFCWAAGFRLLTEFEFCSAQVRRLDKARQQAMLGASCRLRGIQKARRLRDGRRPQPRGQARLATDTYDGFPVSYRRAFQRT